jgi:glucose-1-phosphate adenylyltransferase
MKDTLGVLLAGGAGERLYPLTRDRAKPAVTFGGIYRIIDITLSNCINSDLRKVYILTQYKALSLNRHIREGWNIVARDLGEFIEILPPMKRVSENWYLGTADAVYQNIYSIGTEQPKHVLILSGDHIYKMNYASLIDFHTAKQADVTIATLNVTREEAKRMGILACDPEYRVVQFVEKPAEPPGTLASMGVYVFSRRMLAQVLTEDARRRDSSHDFGKDVIPRMVQGGFRVFAYPFQGYWVDVGTIEAYWQTQMDLLKHPPALDLNDRSWIVHTKSEERPPVRIQEGAVVKDSMITDGCVISAGARVEKSVLSPGVMVGPGAVIRYSVILTDTTIDAGSRIERSVIDKIVRVGRNVHIGQPPKKGAPPVEGSGITTVGKNAHIPAGIRIPRGSFVAADATPEYFLRAAPLPAALTKK